MSNTNTRVVDDGDTHLKKNFSSSGLVFPTLDELILLKSNQLLSVKQPPLYDYNKTFELMINKDSLETQINMIKDILINDKCCFIDFNKHLDIDIFIHLLKSEYSIKFVSQTDKSHSITSVDDFKKWHNNEGYAVKHIHVKPTVLYGTEMIFELYNLIFFLPRRKRKASDV